MSPANLPAPDILRKLLRYEPETGKLFWLHREGARASWNTRYAGKEALTSLSNGYLSGSVFGVGVKAHRAAWAIMTGKWPTYEIDHINLSKSDNRWANLREAQHSQNMMNVAAQIGTASGIKGVTFHRPTRKWKARVGFARAQVYLGLFETKREAEQRVIAARADLHGAFARHT